MQADDGVLLSVEEIGPRDAPLTVVFVHGYSLSMASWAFQRRTLAAELATANGHRPDARLVFYDQRGHGASSRGSADRSTIDQLAHDLATVIEARVPQGPVVLVGHRNITSTRAAYDVSEVQPVDYAATTEVTAESLSTQSEALPNTRLLDPTLVSPAFTQLQQVRGFYACPRRSTSTGTSSPGTSTRRTSWWPPARSTSTVWTRPSATGPTTTPSTPTATA